MPRKKTKCIENDCEELTNGVRCRTHSSKHLTIHHDKKQYARDWHLKKKYGMEPGEFDVWWQACRGKCFICSKQMEYPSSQQGQGPNVVAVDHDHQTGHVRGLLCNACNKGLGMFRDNTELLYKAINYLNG